MNLNDSLEKLKYDKRLVEWNIRNGVIKRDDLNQHLEKLPDTGDNCEPLEIDPEEVASYQ